MKPEPDIRSPFGTRFMALAALALMMSCMSCDHAPLERQADSPDTSMQSRQDESTIRTLILASETGQQCSHGIDTFVLPTTSTESTICTFATSGTVTGLNSAMEITVNDALNIWLYQDGTFEFSLPESASPYSVLVSHHPDNQKCALFHGLPDRMDQATLHIVCSIDDTGVFITQDEIFYALEDDTGSAINISKGLPGMALFDFTLWVDIGPFSGTIASIIVRDGWLYIADDQSLYKASNLSNQAPWSMARSVWRVESEDKVISRIRANESSLTVAYSGNTVDEYIVLSESDITFASCSEPAPTDYNYESDSVYYGTNNWIEYRPGTLPIILAAPHGGYLEPVEVPVFSDGLARDARSQEYTLDTSQFLFAATGERPHIIINHIMRNRLNLNRDKPDDNFSNDDAMRAWEEFHAFVDDAKNWVSQVCGKGLYLDLHTNGFSHNMSGIGFLLDADDLSQTGDQIDLLADSSSLRNVMRSPGLKLFSAALGKFSLGNLLHSKHNKATLPNATNTVENPLSDFSYYTGGYNTRRHGSIDGGVIDSMQVESHFVFVNSSTDNTDKRLDYTEKLALSIQEFMQRWYGFVL